MPSAQAGDVAPGINDAPRIRRDGAADNAEQRSLAGAVRPDNAERLAFCELKADTFRDDDRAEAFGDLFKRKQRRGHRRYFSACRAFAFSIADQMA
jgi:hypothetical protein